MKTITGLLLALTAGVSVGNEEFVSQIIQTRENPDNPGLPIVSFLNDLSPNGSSVAPDVATGATVFELITTNTSTNQIFELDAMTVSTYHPQATISIVTEDPYDVIPRTRVDRNFTVNYTVSGIVTDDPEVQEAAKSVIFEQRVFPYGPDQTEVTNPNNFTIIDHNPVGANGEHALTNITTSIQASDLTTARGEEVFTIHANPDVSFPEPTPLASARVQIWPVADGSLSGIDETKSYNVVPTINITTTDLYPVSDTYLRYYKIDDPSNEETSGLIGNYKPNSNVPVDNNWNVPEMDKRLVEDGVYFVELLHTTVFDTIRLGDPIKITVDRIIKVNANVISSE